MTNSPTSYAQAASRLLILVLLLGLTWLPSGCVTPTGDPVVVNAERGTQIALETFDTWFDIEHRQRAMFKMALPEAHAFTERLRAEAPAWLATARRMTAAYKNTRAEPDRLALARAMAVLNAGLREAETYIARADTKGLK